MQALDEVEFDLVAGEVHALMGENGAGKSTLMKIIAGVQPADGGTIEMRGKCVTIGSPVEAHALGIQTVFQELTVLDNLDVGRNLLLGAEPTRGIFVDERRLYADAQTALADFGVDLDVRTPLEMLTVGMKQLVEIVRAARQAPDVLVMDEPSSALGRREEDLLFDLVGRLRDRGTGIVYISHRMEEVFDLSDRITVFRDGCHVLTDRKDALDRDSLIAAMVGRTVVKDRLGVIEPVTTEVRLQLRGVKRAPRVRGVDLVVRAGEIVGLAGLVGAGRTEIAEIIFGVVEPDAGEMQLDGQAYRPRHQRDALDLGVGYVPEDRKLDGLVLGMPVDENLTLPRLRLLSTLGRLSWARLRDAAGVWIDRLSIKVASGRQRASTLSGGNQQKIVIAKVLSTKPRVLVLDEPTRGIDVGSKREIHELIRSIAADGVAVLMISSELNEILEVSDRIVVMSNGEISGELAAAGAQEEDVVALAFGRAPT